MRKKQGIMKKYFLILIILTLLSMAFLVFSNQEKTKRTNHLNKNKAQEECQYDLIRKSNISMDDLEIKNNILYYRDDDCIISLTDQIQKLDPDYFNEPDEYSNKYIIKHIDHELIIIAKQRDIFGYAVGVFNYKDSSFNEIFSSEYALNINNSYISDNKLYFEFDMITMGCAQNQDCAWLDNYVSYVCGQKLYGYWEYDLKKKTLSRVKDNDSACLSK